jgi:hypothetical protein
MDKTEALCYATAAWVTSVLPRLRHHDPYKIWEAMYEGRCDLAVEVRLGNGRITLVAIDDAQATTDVLYREEVGPLRSDTPVDRAAL